MVDLISPQGSYTPEQEEELRAYGRAMGAIDLGQTKDMMGAGSPWRVLLGALRGIQSKSAIDSVEANRSGRRQRQSRAIPGVVSLSPGTFSETPPGAEAPQPPIQMGSGDLSGVQWGQPGQPIAIRFHNPGAIEFGPFAQQFGARPGRDNPRYAEFDSPETGFRAMHALLNNYMRRGRRTLGSIISEWAPAPENDVGAYVTRVAGAMGINPNTQLSPSDIPRLAMAMFGVESGVNLGGGRTPVTTPVQASASAGQLFTHTFSTTASQSAVTPLGASAPGSVVASVDAGAVGGEGVPVRRVPTIPIQEPPGTSPVPDQTGVGEPGYYAEGNIPRGSVPQRIAVNPALIALLQRFRDPNAMSQADWQTALAEYQRLAVPVEVQTTYGKATYDPLTGELQNFVPGPIIRRPVSTPGGVSTEQLLAPGTSAGGFTIAPIAPTPGLDAPGSVSASASASGGMSPLLTPDLPPFPNSGSINEIAEWGMKSDAIRKMIEKMAETQAGQISTARLAGERASRRIQQLQTIASLRQLAEAQGPNLTGDRLARLQTEVAQFFINFDPRSRDERPGFLNNLGSRELLNKLNAFLASEATQDISARGTNFEFSTLLQNNPNLASSFEGTMMLLSYMMQEQQHIQALARMAGRFSHRTGDWNSTVENFYRQNPIMIDIPSVNGSPAQRISTARIPLPGELKEDGTPWTNEQITQHIRDIVPPGAFFINPRTRRLSLVPPTAAPR